MNIKLTWVVLVILTFIISCSTQKQADLIIYNGTIYTLDDDFSTVEALAISEGKILATGSNEDILSAFASGEEIDLEGKFVYPGLIDPHCHFIGYGRSLMHADLSATNSFEEVIEVLLQQQEEYPTEWVQGWGWDHEDWPEKEFPHRDQLDRVFPDVPVFLTRAAGHSALVNSKALQLAGVTESSRVEGGSLLQKNGKLTGMLIDNAMDLIREEIPRPTQEEVLKMIQMSQASCFEVGLTSVHDAGLGCRTIDLIDSLQEAGILKMRIYAMLTPGKENYESYLFHGPYKTDHLNVRSIKLFSDGALSSRGALMLEEYVDDPGNIGLALNTEEYLRKNMKLAWDNGFQVNTHCIGDSANRWILDMYGEHLKGKNDLRWRIEHVQILSPDDLHKFGDFSIIPSIQSTASTTDMFYAENRVGPIRVKSAYAYRDLMKQNGWIPNGSDFPVESNNPLYGYYALVTRKDLNGYPENGWQMENALSRKEALRAMTIWAARAAFEDNEKGSLEERKMADFIILGEDLMTVSETEMPHMKVQGTFIAGEQVYPVQSLLVSRDKILKTKEINLSEIEEIAMESAKWSLDNNLEGMSYQNMCAAYGVLKIAAVTGKDSLRKIVERVLQPELLEDVNPHRDNATDYPAHQWFGFVPLELYRQTKNPMYLKRGIEMAEEQFLNPDENGMPSYTSRMYIDDIYGATTMQSLAYACTGDDKYLERAVLQVLFYSEKFMQEEGLFYHNVEEAPSFWGRGNGWCAAAYVELLNVMPEDHPERDHVLFYYNRMMEALVKYQGPEGMWYQLIDDYGSWPESSCTCMFLFSMTEGIRMGLLPSKSYTETVVKGWKGLSKYIDEEWRIMDVCAGSSYGDREWYLNRPRLTGDPHGQAPLLWSVSSLLVSLME